MTRCPHGAGPSTSCSQCLGATASRVSVELGGRLREYDPMAKGRKVLRSRAERKRANR